MRLVFLGLTRRGDGLARRVGGEPCDILLDCAHNHFVGDPGEAPLTIAQLRAFPGDGRGVGLA